MQLLNTYKILDSYLVASLYEHLQKNNPPPTINLIFQAFGGKIPNAPSIFIMTIKPTAAVLKTTGQFK
jgi:hypothetical protein